MLPTLCFSTLALVAPVQEPLSRTELVAEVTALVNARAEQQLFSGAVLVAHGDEVLLTLAAGEADRGWHVPNGVGTRFNLGSMNKMFTSIAIAQLAERDVLSFDDPISKWVDESWLPRALTERVTVRHLLTHTSGLGSYFNNAFMRSSRALFRAVDDYKPLVQGETLAFEPGERFRYSNTGMLLLGVVIEKASGQDYFAYVREHVHAPAEMTRTDCFELDQPVEDLAVGYERDPAAPGGWRNNLFLHVMRGGPAGGGYSTVGDLHRFAQALLSRELVGVSTLDVLWTDAVGADYGCGFSVVDAPQKIVGHSGGFPGISANLDVFVETGWIVAVLANQGGAAVELSRAIRERVLRVAE
jgi:CubicO group peptidase (beta-lactamase class C family)